MVGKLIRKFHLRHPVIHLGALEERGVPLVFGRKKRGEAELFEECPSDFVSRKHCVLTYSDERYRIKDLKSTNGTFVNGIKLVENEEKELKFGDEIGLGVSANSDEVDAEDACYFIFTLQDGNLNVVVPVIDLVEDEDVKPSISKQSSNPSPESVNALETNGILVPRSSHIPPAPPPPVIRVMEKPPSVASTSSRTNLETSSEELALSTPMQVTASSGTGGNAPSSSSGSPVKEVVIPTPPTVAAVSQTNTKSASVPPVENGSSGAVAEVPSVATSKPPVKGKTKLPVPAVDGPIDLDLESLSSDDSSDGLQENPPPSKKPGKKESQAAALPEDKTSEETKKDNTTTTTACSSKSICSVGGELVKIWPEVAADPKLTKSKAFPRSRQLIKTNKNSGTACILKGRFDHLRHRDQVRISKQWRKSWKKCQRKKSDPTAERIPSSSSSYDSSDSSDWFVKVKKGKSSKDHSKRPATQDEHHSSHQKPPAEEPPKKKAKVETRKPSETEQGPSRRYERRETGSTEEDEDISFSQPYHTPTHSLSPVSDHTSSDIVQMDAEEGHQYSDVSDREIEFVEQPTTSPLYEKVNESEPKPSSSTAKASDLKAKKEVNVKAPQQRSTKMLQINDAPLPREVRRNQQRNANTAQSSHPAPAATTSLSPPFSSNTSSSVKDRLRDVAEKEKAKRNQTPQPIGSPQEFSRAPPPPPVKAKCTTKSRNDGFLSDFMGPTTKKSDKDEKLASTTIPAPARELRQVRPSPSPAAQSAMPVNSILQKMDNSNKAFGEQASTSKAAQQPTPVDASAQRPNLMEKPGSVLERDEQRKQNAKSNVINYHHGAPKKVQQRSASTDGSVVTDDLLFRRILAWNPDWLQQQSSISRDPPILQEEERHLRALSRYVDYASYLNTFIPLLLLEIWATITQDVVKTKESLGRGSGRITDFPIFVKMQHFCEVCPILQSDWMSRRGNLKQAKYTALECYTLMSEKNEISTKLDFAVLNVESVARQGNIDKRDHFGFIMFATEEVKEITGVTSIDPSFRKKFTNPKFIRSFTVILRAREYKVKTEGFVKRISYLGAKLREFKALMHLKNSKLYSNVLEPSPASWNPQDKPANAIREVQKLNRAQQAVVAHVCNKVKANNQPELMLVHGPPGTGKTRTIVALILQLLNNRSPKENKKILVCTPSNNAVDEIMRRLESAMNGLPGGKSYMMVRFGEVEGSPMKKYSIDEQMIKNDAMIQSIDLSLKEKNKQIKDTEEAIKSSKSTIRSDSLKQEMDELKKERWKLETQKGQQKFNLVFNREKGNISIKKQEILEKADILCGTLNSCSNSLLNRAFGPRSKANSPFMCCIVDEATQATEPETLAPLLLQVDKLVLCGDPNQLGATVLSQTAEEKMYGQSLFSRVYGCHAKDQVMSLTEQYRMHPQILHFPNEYFYGGSLKTSGSFGSTSSLKPYLFLNLSSKETSNKEGQISNEDEVKMVVEIIKSIMAVVEPTKRSGRDLRIGVITPYNCQKASIVDKIKSEIRGDVGHIIEVDTVDSFQGREKDIIIISCVRTDATGFLKSKKRLNVALTRAKQSLLIVGNASCLKKEGMWNSLMQNAEQRECWYNIPPEGWKDAEFLKQSLFSALSPKKTK